MLSLVIKLYWQTCKQLWHHQKTKSHHKSCPRLHCIALQLFHYFLQFSHQSSPILFHLSVIHWQSGLYKPVLLYTLILTAIRINNSRPPFTRRDKLKHTPTKPSRSLVTAISGSTWSSDWQNQAAEIFYSEALLLSRTSKQCDHKATIDSKVGDV